MNKQFLGALMTTLVAGGLSSTAMAEHHEEAKKTTKTTKTTVTTETKTVKADFWCLNNSCKGKSACAGNGNASCHGKNECKGKGILEASTDADCTTAGGLWAAKKTEAKKK